MGKTWEAWGEGKSMIRIHHMKQVFNEKLITKHNMGQFVLNLFKKIHNTLPLT